MRAAGFTGLVISVFALLALRPAAGGEQKPDAPPLTAEQAEALVAQLASEKPDEAAKAADQLAAAGESALPALIKQAKSRNELVRKRVAAILGRIITKESLQALYDVLAVEQPAGKPAKSVDVCRELICSIGNHREAGSIEKLQDLLLNKDALLRLEAVMALGRIGDAAALPLVKRSCLDDEAVVRKAAVVALGLIADRSAAAAVAPDLIARLRDDDKPVRAMAYLVLKKLSGTDFEFDPAADDQQRAESVRLWETWYKANQNGGTGGGTGKEQNKSE